MVGHEYFHNWTGNRVTCRDWFQVRTIWWLGGVIRIVGLALFASSACGFGMTGFCGSRWVQELGGWEAGRRAGVLLSPPTSQCPFECSTKESGGVGRSPARSPRAALHLSWSPQLTLKEGLTVYRDQVGAWRLQ